MGLKINTDAVVRYTNQLEKISRSALPVAIRTALNSVAFDVKKNSLIKSSEKEFTTRQKNFFRANSRVEMASGFDITSMKSVVGMVEGGLKGGNNYAVRDLEQQEYGGTISGKSFIPMDSARSGKNNARIVRPSNRISGIKKIVETKKLNARTRQAKFIEAAKIVGGGGYVLHGIGKETLFRIDSVNGGMVRSTPLYSFRKSRKISVKGRGFMSGAAMESVLKIDEFYIQAAEKQFAKINA